MLKINLKETRQQKTNLQLLQQKCKLSEFKFCKNWHSRSFELPSISLLQSYQQQRQQTKFRTNLNIPNVSQLCQSETLYTRQEKDEIIEVASITNNIISEIPLKKCILRRVSQLEYVGSKQKRLNNLAPSIQIFQHSKDAAILKKKKMNRLKMQYKFMQRANQKKHIRNHRSRSVPLKSILKITHKRAKTISDQQYQGPITKIDPELEQKIYLLLQRNRNSHLIIRRRTCIQEPKNSIFVSRDKLLKYHEVMAKKFDQFDSSCESSPVTISRLQFQKSYTNKLQVIDSENHQQYLTPRLNQESNHNIFIRKASHSVIAQYVLEKSKKNKNNNIYKTKLPNINQPSLNEFNQYFIAQKKTNQLKNIAQQIVQSKSSDNLPKQIQLNSRQSQFINKQFNMIKQDSQICNSTRIKTLPSDTTTSRNKINLQLKLWPYFQ
ncbi:unnamed protein product [Paramecium sonneborni]|uniref:Uncharacterized protein n=1 Tax=Paramecium sonneborni TaxID=65129 RepID=A0A8S1MUW8_9CILI|nr:unnamed protein product [Paramecium sonneborni]